MSTTAATRASTSPVGLLPLLPLPLLLLPLPLMLPLRWQRRVRLRRWLSWQQRA